MNRILFGVFTCTGLIFLLLRDCNNAVIFLGLAPIGDPFAPVPLRARPTWQRVWLYTHVTMTVALLVMTIRGLWRC